MSIYLCVQCGRWHDTEASMKKCKHKDVEVVKDPEPVAVDWVAEAKDLRDASPSDDVKAVAEGLGIEYTTKREALAAIREAVDGTETRD